MPAGPQGAHVLQRIQQLCQQVTVTAGVDGAGAALVAAGGSRGTICTTDSVAQAVEEAQFTLGEGPCVDAASSMSPVLVDDLLDRSHGVQDRWPGFLEAAAQAGARALFAFPLRIGGVALGAIDLYRCSPGPLQPEELRAALLTADAAALVLLDLVDGQEALPAASLRLSIHGAAGKVMVQLGTSIADALVQIRALAYAQGRSVEAVAADVLADRLRFPVADA